MRELTLACAHPDAALAIAAAGLESMRSSLVVAGAGEAVPLARALDTLEPAGELGTELITGASRRVRTLRVPYRGRDLEGVELSEQLERWVEAGCVEPSFATAIRLVSDNPDWLALRGRTIALVGAGAEIGPLAPLSAWGADVVALDVPRPQLWERVGEIARRGAGTVRIPLTPDDGAGVDVLRSLPETRRWLEQASGEGGLVLGMYAYADGGRHVLLSGAFDVLAEDLLAGGQASGVAFLATPTDVFLVPGEAVAHARRAYADRRLRKVAQAPLQALSRGRLFAPAYRQQVAVADALVKQQGPNYAIAKRLQRWRGVVSDAAGHQVSFNVAPATWTRSVTNNRILAAAYGGASRFGIEVLRPETTRVLMAAMLVHDLQQGRSFASDPERLFSDGAAHGGLWRAAYEPRSALGIAALAGMPAAVLQRGR